jgi:hypothetical protein
MNPHTALTSIGSGITTFFIVTVLVIEGLSIEYSAIVALPIGLVAGIAVVYYIPRTIGDLSASGKSILAGYAVFCLLLLLLLVVRSVNIAQPFSPRLAFSASVSLVQSSRVSHRGSLNNSSTPSSASPNQIVIPHQPTTSP